MAELPPARPSPECQSKLSRAKSRHLKQLSSQESGRREGSWWWSGQRKIAQPHVLKARHRHVSGCQAQSFINSTPILLPSETITSCFKNDYQSLQRASQQSKHCLLPRTLASEVKSSSSLSLHCDSVTIYPALGSQSPLEPGLTPSSREGKHSTPQPKHIGRIS